MSTFLLLTFTKTWRSMLLLTSHFQHSPVNVGIIIIMQAFNKNSDGCQHLPIVDIHSSQHNKLKPFNRSFCFLLKDQRSNWLFIIYKNIWNIFIYVHIRYTFLLLLILFYLFIFIKFWLFKAKSWYHFILSLLRGLPSKLFKSRTIMRWCMWFASRKR